MKQKIVILVLLVLLNSYIFSIDHVPPLSDYPEISESELENVDYSILEHGKDYIIVEFEGKTYIHWI